VIFFLASFHWCAYPDPCVGGADVLVDAEVGGG
jgi:hypothetical protein